MWQLWGHDGTLVVEDNGDLVFVFGPQADPAKARFGHRRFPRGVIAWAETVDGGWLAKPYFRLHRIGEPRRPDADPSRNSDILLLTGDDQVAAVRPLVAELCADREPPVEQPFDDVVLREDIARAASDADLFLAKRSLRALPEQVTDDETVEFMTSGSHDGDSGLVVVTDRRLLHVSESRMFGSSTLSIPVGQIVSVEMSSAGFGEAAGSLVVHTSSGETAFDVVGDDGLKEITARLRRAADDADRHAGAPPAGPPAAPPAGPAAAASAAPGGTQRLLDELRQLGELRDSGVITPEEFDRLKDRLIGDI